MPHPGLRVPAFFLKSMEGLFMSQPKKHVRVITSADSGIVVSKIKADAIESVKETHGLSAPMQQGSGKSAPAVAAEWSKATCEWSKTTC